MLVELQPWMPSQQQRALRNGLSGRGPRFIVCHLLRLVGIAMAGMKMFDYCLPMHHAFAVLHGANPAEIYQTAQLVRSMVCVLVFEELQ